MTHASNIQRLAEMWRPQKPAVLSVKRTSGLWRAAEFIARTVRALSGVVVLLPPAAPLKVLALRVGVTGHLNIDVKCMLEERCREVLVKLRAELEAAKPEYARLLGAPPDDLVIKIHLISSLAAGADQIVAEVAKELGYTLQAVLPTRIQDFRLDMLRNGGTLDGFEALARASENSLELSGCAVPGMEEYRVAAAAVLQNCDILIACTSADAQDGVSVELLRSALQRGVPVLWLDSDAPSPPTILGMTNDRSSESKHAFDGGAARLVGSLLFGTGSSQAMGQQRVWHRLLGKFERRFRGTFNARYNEDQWLGSWPQLTSGDPELLRGRWLVESNFRQVAVWADFEAAVYSTMFRGAFALNAWLGILATGLALCSVASKAWGTWAKVGELIVLGAMTLTYLASRAGLWREHWLNHRALYQRVHHGAWCFLLGEPLVGQSKMEARLGGNTLRGLPRLLLAASERAAGLTTGSAQTQYLAAVRDFVVKGLVDRQIRYFASEGQGNAHLYERYEKIVATCVLIAFAGTASYLAAVCFDRYVSSQALDVGSRVSTILGALFPLAAASFVAVAGFEEFGQTALRSQEMSEVLLETRRRMVGLDPPSKVGPSSPRRLDRRVLAGLLHDALRAADEELTHWRIVRSSKDVERF